MTTPVWLEKYHGRETKWEWRRFFSNADMARAEAEHDAVEALNWRESTPTLIYAIASHNTRYLIRNVKMDGPGTSAFIDPGEGDPLR